MSNLRQLLESAPFGTLPEDRETKYALAKRAASEVLASGSMAASTLSDGTNDIPISDLSNDGVLQNMGGSLTTGGLSCLGTSSASSFVTTNASMCLMGSDPGKIVGDSDVVVRGSMIRENRSKTISVWPGVNNVDAPGAYRELRFVPSGTGDSTERLLPGESFTPGQNGSGLFTPDNMILEHGFRSATGVADTIGMKYVGGYDAWIWNVTDPTKAGKVKISVWGEIIASGIGGNLSVNVSSSNIRRIWGGDNVANDITINPVVALFNTKPRIRITITNSSTDTLDIFIEESFNNVVRID